MGAAASAGYLGRPAEALCAFSLPRNRKGDVMDATRAMPRPRRPRAGTAYQSFGSPVATSGSWSVQDIWHGQRATGATPVMESTATQLSEVVRTFLGWDGPGIVLAVAQFVRHFGVGRDLDLSHVMVVVPGHRAGRRLIELLVAAAERDGWILTPPSVVTAGELPERLYRPQKPFAPVLVQRLHRAAALPGLDPGVRAAILPHPPAPAEPPPPVPPPPTFGPRT